MTTAADPGPGRDDRRTLARLAAAGADGVLVLHGDPGGRIHLRGGRVTLVLVTGRPDPRPAAAARAHPVGVEIRALRDLVDLAFLLFASPTREHAFRPGEADAGSLADGIPVDRLSAELERRFAAVANAGPALHPTRSRVAPVTPLPGRPPLALLPVTPGEQAVLAAADGRRSCVELADATGRGVFAVTLDATRLVNAGLLRALRPDEQAGPGPVTPLPRRRPGGSGAPATRPPGGPAPRPGSDPELLDRLIIALDAL